jgi:F-type H+-transporting ATPase subunit b
MKLVAPDIGLLFWMLLMFGIVLFILTKFAWKPIVSALKDRQRSIDESLRSAEKAKKDMEKLQADNEKILMEARRERDLILKEAKEIKTGIVDGAKKEASDEAKKIIDSAKKAIKSETDAAINELRQKVADLSVDIAEKILRESLKADKEQKDLIERLIKEIKLN